MINKSSGRLSDLLRLGKTMPAEAYDAAEHPYAVAWAVAPAAAEQLPLVQHYPNPFRQQVTISFTTLTEAAVALAIYDVAGRLVYQRAEQLPAGIHHWPIAADQLAGRGYYTYRLGIGHTVFTQPLLLLE